MQPPPDIPDHELLRLIGRGAYGEVWLARNVMGIMRAVKVVRRTFFTSSRPFEREFSAVRRYEPVSRNTAGLVNVLHAGRAADGSHFHYVMELADCAEPGVEAATEPDAYVPCTLRVVIGRMGRIPVGDCLDIAVSLAHGIADLHRVGLVHRDVKPSNIIFVGGRAKLADIGLVGDSTESRSYVGTEGYVPPEGPGQPGADLYALGRVLYEMTTGYEASKFPALPPEWAKLQEQAAFEFFEVVLHCCEPHFARRYQRAEELLADLALLQSGQSVRQVRQMKHRIAWLKKVATISVALGSIAFLLVWWQGRLVTRAEKAEAEARENLFTSLVQQAQNVRRSGDPDARFVALELLERASQLHPGDSSLREAMVSALAIPGLRLLSKTPAAPHLAMYNWHQGGVCAREIGRQLLAGKMLSLPQKIEGTKWLHAIAEDAENQRLYARDNLGHLHTWKNGVLEPPLVAAGIGECQWSVTPDGKQVIAWGADGKVSVISPEKPEQRQEWTCPCGFEGGLAPVCSTDGQSVAFCRATETSISVHSLPGGQLVANLPSPQRLSGALAVSADASVVAAGFENGSVGIWRSHSQDFQPCEVLESGQGFINSLAISPDGRHLVTTCWSGLTYLWDLATGTRLTRTTLPNSLPSFADNGRKLALCGLAGDFLYEFDSGACVSVILPRQKIVSTSGPATRFQVHPTAPLLALPTGREIVLVNSTNASVQPPGIPLETTDIAFTGDGKFLLAGNAQLFRIPCNKSGQIGTPTPWNKPTTSSYSQLRSSADGQTVVGWRRDGFWSILSDSGKLATLPMAADSSEYCSLHPSGNRFAQGHHQSGVTVWNTADGKQVCQIPAEGHWTSCSFSPHGNFLVLGDAKGMKLFATDTWTQLWQNDTCGNSEMSRNQWFSPDSRWLLKCPQLGTIGLYRTDSGRAAIHFQSDHESPPAQLAMTGDGTTLWELQANHQTLWRWNLKHIRSYLRNRGLDWLD